MRKALVIGYGISGKASAALLLAKGFSVTVVDRKVEEGCLPDDPSLDVSKFAFAVLSPGIETFHPLVKKLKSLNIEVIGEIELAFRYLPNTKIFGVTGSNGKTTTVLLTAHILNEAGIDAAALGNVGGELERKKIQDALSFSSSFVF